MPRILFLIGLLLLIDLYAYQAFRLLWQNVGASWRLTGQIVYWLIPVGTFLYLWLGLTGKTAEWSRPVTTYIPAAIFILYISKFLVVPALLIDDLRRVVQAISSYFSDDPVSQISRSRFLAQAGILIGSLPFISLTYGMLRNPYRYQLFRKKIRIPNLPESLEGLRIIQISDIHSGSFTFREPVQRAIDLINEQDADLVLFTGDLVNNRAEEMEPFQEMFSKIRSRYGVFSVLGNHDYGDYHDWPSEEAKRENFEQLVNTHKEMGWRLLRNEHQKIMINGEEIAIIGVENYSAHPRFPKHGDLSKAYQGAEQSTLKLLLSHDPSHWQYEVTRVFQDIALTLSGHTHGMQFGIEIPGFLKWSPIKYVYKQWAGLYQEGQQQLYVNRGLGFLGYPGRVGILPEITYMELSKG